LVTRVDDRCGSVVHFEGIAVLRLRSTYR
jgi:hypothetical protein